jgi:hypothetical protein
MFMKSSDFEIDLRLGPSKEGSDQFFVTGKDEIREREARKRPQVEHRGVAAADNDNNNDDDDDNNSGVDQDFRIRKFARFQEAVFGQETEEQQQQ